MKKRRKIIALVTTLCLCLSLFVVGVLAATSAKFNVTSTLNFTADGVYVMVDASLKQGADVGTAAVLAEGAPTQPTFKAYSYPRETGQDYPNGAASTTYFVDSTGAQVDTWAIGDINYTSTNKVVVYEFTVSNYSPFEVQGTVSGISEALVTYVEQGQLTIATYTGTSSSSATATASPTYSFNIPARTNETTPGVTCYKIAVTLNNFMNNLATGEIVMNVSFVKTPTAADYLTWVADDPDTTTANDGYWTLTMGEYQGTPLKWRMVLKENEEGTDVESVANYTQDTALSGSYYFLLDTYKANVFNCSFENNYTNSSPYPRLDEYKSTVNVNDYAVSNIREYLTGTDVYRGYTRSGSNRIPELATGQEKEENFLDVFNITSSPVYNLIEGRTLSDLYSRMAQGTSGTAVTFDTDVKNGVGELAGIDPDTTKDKLWLLSYYEAYKITGNKSPDSGARSWGANYWLRSPSSSVTNFVNYVYASGKIGTALTAYLTYCARPAFKISIT
ncbi:MAG TPA: hypothetical protein IAA62_02495 [Candidatus Caccopulliclostridium gallistercoris]|uniref:DUF6273 domain-containing protein n=1 Tax=Candidatus Caccopulliclostridium gallistercoris TaxID=2840719 RepID=A0A9D1SZ57_9FIRM|nr:hypothetical protein [Candidatus Caccopulliclostridium gallistercoris]